MDRTVVEQIKERLTIDEVVSQYVKLDKSGSSYKAKCPFHNEKSPSFFVSPDRGGYYCFGCGAKGDIFTFVEQFEGLDFRGALKILAERAGIRLTFDKKADGERDRLFEVMDTAAHFFEIQFGQNKEVQEYVKKRGITDSTRIEFRIGWAPEGWSNLHLYFKKKGFNDSLIEKAGLIKKKEMRDKGHGHGESDKENLTSDYYDRFRGRVMFPIMDSSGRVIAFSGRILPRLDDGKAAKYLNSPDTPLYDKSLVLYGLNKAKSDIRRLNYTIMVEGQMDLVMSHQAGIKNTVASSGTALTDESFSETGAVSNLNLVRRLSSNIILAFDSDKAGRMAAMRAVAATAISMGMAVKIADIEGGKDPADIVLLNPDEWKKILRNAKHVIEYELNNVLRDVTDPRKVGRAVKERIFPYLIRMDSEMDKAFYIKMIADKTNVSEQAVWDDVRAFGKTFKPAESDKKAETENKKIESGNHMDLIERRMFGLLILIEKSSLPTATEYRKQIKKIAGDSYADRIARIESLASDIIFEAEAFFSGDQKNWDHHMKELIINFEEDVINQELITAMNELKTAEKARNVEKVAELAQKCQVLSMRKAEVGKKKRG
ncbi:MAG: DNA primase [Candidatus Taylorbacteria bacterium RIFCSPHIGHO2_02_FULL_45_28]|uniref:DNA primase n=1 Tax=Candidatus Taylorbacteria bacterium RIFCSPHIGHO2_12_FULL_45_16 TaxID=1802315 RepID=A0A1G2MZ84_9BACT|nr:MAG: DNA primase [Candidatus Taylorbacteria bacterium RIFCSPHIGHO2_01_FULL_44_110]OHA25481.1 MAG: DNA primase [Candidatus Taylorbacteria bacterium RIFCSPHIGHO2_02_FULL_45_28]OHA29148.1 MAG: DNA primase [Candidatus Taylorbacteria bacterium RIFCSPHIGHO2_12_FULL_45_16]OHA33370.1 MAG: DNA primase [Candidatus Taylorbacteria bacterium RIFCSPLOWO2_01_FULL_45_59]